MALVELQPHLTQLFMAQVVLVALSHPRLLQQVDPVQVMAAHRVLVQLLLLQIEEVVEREVETVPHL